MAVSLPCTLVEGDDALAVRVHATAWDLCIAHANRRVALPAEDVRAWAVDAATARVTGPNFVVSLRFADGASRDALLARLPASSAPPLPLLPRASPPPSVAEGPSLSSLASFPRQQLAFDALDALGNVADPFLVAQMQCPSTGVRSFVLARPRDFWGVYLRTTSSLRHAFEIIREGCACRIYLDLEFDASRGDVSQGPALVSLVILHVARAARDSLGVFLAPEAFLQLDSTSATKFSRHVIVPSLVLSDNAAVGTLVADAVSRLRDAGLERAAGMVDLSVYSRNRAFRMLYSSKFGKRKVLQVARENRFPCDEDAGAYRLFLDALVCPHGANAPRRPSSPPGVPVARPATLRARRVAFPLPALEAWVTQLASAQAGGGRSAFIRSWLLQGDDVVCLGVGGARYCANVGREHRGNHVFFIVALARLVARQGCTDVESCAGYRSPDVAVPADAVPENWRELLHCCSHVL